MGDGETDELIIHWRFLFPPMCGTWTLQSVVLFVRLFFKHLKKIIDRNANN